MLFITGGILFATSSTGKSTASADEANESMPEIVQAAIAAPAFFFDDATDALTTHFGSESAPEPSTEAMPQGNTKITAPADDSTSVSLISTPALPTAPSTPASFTTRQAPGKLLDHPSIAALRSKATAPAEANITEVSVKAGNTLSGILNDHGVKIDQMPKLLTDSVVKEHLSNLRIGQKLEIVQLPNGDFHSLRARVGNDRRITIRRAEDDFAIASIDLPVEKERVVTSGTIEQSLYLAAEQADLKQSTIMELADIFQWELDFAKDIRKGDQFSLVYDRLYRDGTYIGDGDILAAEFIRGGKTHRAIRFTTDDGTTSYYSPDGQSMRRAFMRHPVDVVRITSKFNPNRLHPVLHQIRAHRGVDYGSPHGSPIYATADGKVKFSGTNGAYGKTVVLQHGKKFSTLYAHMSRISDKSIVGKRVKQGDVIGYVGRSGRVTGTHLHYEFRVNNEQIDPLKVELPAAQPIDPQYLPELKAISKEMTAQMQSVLIGANEQVATAPTNTLPKLATAR